jgi:Fe-Mn family superoxide dismutase
MTKLGFNDYFTEAKVVLVQEPLPYGTTDLAPILSKKSLDYHYGSLANGYVTRFNKGEGDPTFNFNGAKLHNLFFPQLKKPSMSNAPIGASLQVINSVYKSFDKFKKEVQRTAMSIQGSGWIYMSVDGSINIIENHEYKSNMKIALLIDWWEHVWALDYQSDKAKYLEHIWQAINWTVVNDRIQGAQK